MGKIYIWTFTGDPSRVGIRRSAKVKQSFKIGPIAAQFLLLLIIIAISLFYLNQAVMISLAERKIDEISTTLKNLQREELDLRAESAKLDSLSNSEGVKEQIQLIPSGGADFILSLDNFSSLK